MDGVDVPGVVGVGLEFPAQAADGVVDGPRGRLVREAPDLPEQFITLDDASFALGEVAEQVELCLLYTSPSPRD